MGIHFFIFNFLVSKPDFKLSKDFNISSVGKNTKIRLDEIRVIPKKELLMIKTLGQKRSKNMQIVANENHGIEEKPNNSRFLSEKNQTYLHQTQAKRNGSFKAQGYGQNSGSEDVKAKIAEVKKVEAPKPAREKTITPKKDLNLADLAIGLKTHTLSEVEEVKNEATEKENAQKEEMQRSLGSLEGDKSKSGLAQNNDFIEDVPLGEMTQMNTQEFKYYGFYNRIKFQLEQFWGKSISEKARSLYRSGRRMPTNDNMITSVIVELDERGNIVNIKISGSSGVRELDRAAVESFQKAGPFPNPPKGLVVDGKAVIQWGFVVRS